MLVLLIAFYYEYCNLIWLMKAFLISRQLNTTYFYNFN